MTNISKYILNPSQLRKLHRQFYKTISKLNTHETSIFFDELLGREEKIMIIKRFATIVMLIENNSPYRIAQLLHMSQSTVKSIKIKFNSGEYQYIEKMFQKNKKEYEEFWKTLEIILRAGMPPRGRGRWKSVFEILGDKQK